MSCLTGLVRRSQQSIRSTTKLAYFHSTPRLRQLERHITERSRCQQCHGEGWPHFILRDERAGKPSASSEPAAELGCPECGRMPKYLFNIVLEGTRTRPASFPVVDEVVGEPATLPEHNETRQRA